MDIERFRIPEKKALDLGEHPTDFTGDYIAKEQAEKDLKSNIKRLRKLQDVLFADNKHSLLIIFQAMDAAGKDGAIKHVMSGVNPQGTQVFSFKKPSPEELDHGYLWRCAKSAPERGRIGIFNRSYYEDVLVVRVHPVILESSPLPTDIKKDPDIWQKRFGQISNFEKYLTENGTKVIKFYLNVSKEEQKRRFIARIDTPEKNWKFSDADVRERSFWDEYQDAYREAIGATSTEASPWYVMPADRKWYTRLAVSEVICQTLESMGLEYPAVGEDHLKMLAESKDQLIIED
ncbi:MAG: polyphosphate kinase 2 family protein [Acidobacteriota bacterium]|nr:polyphosphate kinase 2 family protein [Acidobacteriota bacterium]MDH3529395.1 polyphosphate kinase 2 family protein [Acidobacteriota bacterium]